MPEVHHQTVIDAPIETVWDFVKDMSNWASQMPGYQNFEVVSDVDSVWTLFVDIGPFKRTIVFDVHVTNWNEPTEVTFELKGRSEPVKGAGSYHATPQDGRTQIDLDLTVEGSGMMAPMISTLAGPVLKKMGEEFADNLKRAIEEHAATTRG